MPYVRSQALVDFNEWLKEALRLARLSDNANIKTFKLSEPVLCAAVFLSFARFETFVKDLIAETLSQLQAKYNAASKLPGLITAAHLAYEIEHDKFRKYYASENHREFLEALNLMIQNNSFQWSNPAHSAPLSTKALLREISYPKPDNIASLFYRIGIPDLFPQLDKSLKKDCRKILVSINDLRVQMAHFGLPSGMTKQDIIDKLIQLKLITSKIDRITLAYVNRSK